ncbi:cytochrome b/b6 domain-containing protein [Limnobacter humi]|uniref:Cytochrome b/b6 domain-containing protein n=1 Tax=Limnobacter humi TaxID=1778671 RepID=A0ABT1WGW3_9BURK|nr:cytochrome b/b6 domain-containing protein [Limnobacter humi]MCQ8896760.1 cytochrome b/b6 domain-containing protein [Limnobacter humi]
MAHTSSSIHPRWVRAWHWLNALAIGVMVTSGWKIFNASPLFAWYFPPEITLGGWLGGALQWHFAAMWLLVVNLLVYLGFSIITGRLRHTLITGLLRNLVSDVRAFLRGQLSHANPLQYNAIQKLAYLGVLGLIALVILSGLVLWKSVQFGLLRDLLGGYETARWIHFGAMSGIVLFVVIHLAMVALVPRTLLAMLGLEHTGEQ